jgi:hypothetical protein
MVGASRDPSVPGALASDYPDTSEIVVRRV